MVGINSNVAASSATSNLGKANNVVSSSIAKLSSGNRIIKASDDVAGLAIGTSIASTVKTLEISLLNTQQASSVLSIADGALDQIGALLSRQKALAVQANNGALGATERGYLNQEFTALTSEIDRIVNATKFNGITLLDGSLAGAAGATVDAPASYTAYGTPGSSVTSVTVSSFDDADFQGAFGTFAVVSFDENTGTGGEDVTLRTTLGDKTYISAPLTANTAADGDITAATTLVFTATDGSGSQFTLTLAAQTGVLNTSGSAATYAGTLTTDLASVSIYQNRNLNSVAANANNTAAAGIGAVTIRSNDFDTTANTFGDITSVVGVAGTGTASSLTIIINGTTFSKTDIGSSGTDDEVLDTNDTSTGLTLIGRDAAGNDNGQRLIIDVSGLTSVIHTQNQDEVDTFVDALKTYLGLGGSGSGGLSFQVGANVTDSISVSVGSVRTTDIYKNDAGVYSSIDITTQTNAQTAIDILDNAIASVISRRADAGATQSRLNFAASNLEVSVANNDNARGAFLDADTATESTKFATAQVQLQASIAVLAQANALPRTLLTLLQ